jgi:hypothetical protein
MTLPIPKLDDRTFSQLVTDTREWISKKCPGWTDLSPSDPGMVLLEVFAYLTETTIYRLNRLPEKAYIEFLNLLGVQLQPPAAAHVSLRFSRAKDSDDGTPLEIPRGTVVTVNRPGGWAEPPLFVTAEAATIPPRQQQVDVLAYHRCELEMGESIGEGTGQAGQSFVALHPPILAPTGDALDLQVGVETSLAPQDKGVPVIHYGKKDYRIWSEVSNFSNLKPTDLVYVAERITGTIIFAPAIIEKPAAPPAGPKVDPGLEAHTLAAVPPHGREIRLWYAHGGGTDGNVSADTLTVLKDPIPGVTVTNPEPAAGGRAAETLENALLRGRQQIRSIERAVTARDFERSALYSGLGSVARAKAFAQASQWSYAQPGTVDVLLVPDLPDKETGSGQLTGEVLEALGTQVVRERIHGAIEQCRPLGISCNVKWTRYKQVHVNARVIVRREDDKDAIRQRVAQRLSQSICPLPSQVNATGWPYGQPLHASDVYNIILDDAGVLWTDTLSLEVDEAPDQSVTTLAHDPFQPHTWYAGSGAILFRSLNNGDGWEPVGRFPGRQVTHVRVNPHYPGLLAVLTQEKPGEAESQVHISHDCGETWEASPVQLAFQVRDQAWTRRGELPALLLATDVGLYELVLEPGSSPIQVLVDPANQSLGFYSVTVANESQGMVSVAVSAENTLGLYLSNQGGLTRTFRKIGLEGEDVRRMAIQYDGPRAYLWAGTASTGGDDGRGCYRWELRGTEDPPERWLAFNKGWNGGSVHSLAFVGLHVLAASHHGGLMRLDASSRTNSWKASDINCRLPLRDSGHFLFYPVDAVASDNREQLTMCAGLQGVMLSRNEGDSYEPCSKKEFLDKVTLPDTWLFVSGIHMLSVVAEHEIK